MRRKTTIIFCSFYIFIAGFSAHGENVREPEAADVPGRGAAAVEMARYEKEFSSVRLEPARRNSQSGIAVIFEGTDDLHYYARPETAPAPGYELRIEAKADQFDFGKALFPKWSIFQDPAGKQVEVYAGGFTVFLPIATVIAPPTTSGDVQVKISGMACTSTVCLSPFEKTLRMKVDWNQRQSWKEISLEGPYGGGWPSSTSTQPVWFALGLAFLAGLALNIMPCVWPVLPLIVMRIVGQAKESRSLKRSEGARLQTAERFFAALRMTKQQMLGLTFCLGILLFFAALAGANIVLQVFYGMVLQWGDQFRSPIFVAAMALLLVLLAVFMFGVFTITVPSSIGGKASSRGGYFAALGMGFLAAILSTPCSFGILAAAFAWAQSQPLLPASIAIMIIGVGMALPYAVLTSMPGLLDRLPRPGRWMELFKQGIGFVLLVIAVKLVTALPQARIGGVLYFGVVLGFCAWIWGTWVGYGATPARKWLVRLLAIALALGAGWVFLPAPSYELIDWQNYDALSVQTAPEQGHPVLIKFTADWCLACRTVEKLVYSRKDIAGLIGQKGVLAIKADTSEWDSPATLALKHAYNEPGVPVSMLFVPGKKEPIKWRGILFANKLKSRLEQLPDKPNR
jgi:thiol:disulfide interchange protein